MALDEIQAAIVRDFIGPGGAPIRMPTISGKSDDELLAVIEGLQRRHYVRVVGPPNQNSLHSAGCGRAAPAAIRRRLYKNASALADRRDRILRNLVPARLNT